MLLGLAVRPSLSLSPSPPPRLVLFVSGYQSKKWRVSKKTSANKHIGTKTPGKQQNICEKSKLFFLMIGPSCAGVQEHAKSTPRGENKKRGGGGGK